MDLYNFCIIAFNFASHPDLGPKKETWNDDMLLYQMVKIRASFPREDMSHAGQPMVEGHDWLSLLLHQPLGFPYSSRLPCLQLALPDSGDFSILPSSIQNTRPENPSFTPKHNHE